MKVSKLRHAWTDEDEAHEKAGQRNAPEQAERGQGVQHGPDEDEDRRDITPQKSACGKRSPQLASILGGSRATRKLRQSKQA